MNHIEQLVAQTVEQISICFKKTTDMSHAATRMFCEEIVPIFADNKHLWQLLQEQPNSFMTQRYLEIHLYEKLEKDIMLRHFLEDRLSKLKKSNEKTNVSIKNYHNNRLIMNQLGGVLRLSSC
jgi:hypothetical protein